MRHAADERCDKQAHQPGLAGLVTAREDPLLFAAGHQGNLMRLQDRPLNSTSLAVVLQRFQERHNSKQFFPAHLGSIELLELPSEVR